MKRPTGVTVIAVLLWFTGVINVIGGLATMDDLSGFWGGFQLVTGIVAIAFGFGCWFLKKWAWAGTIVLMGLNAVSLIAVWIQYSDRVNVSRLLLPLAINIVVIIYLMRPELRKAFGK